MQHCNPCKTPVDTESKLGSDGDPISDPVSDPVSDPQICLYMHDPRDPHFTALKRILRYVRGTIDHGLQLHISSTSQLTAYTDAIVLVALLLVTLSRSSAEAEYRGVTVVYLSTNPVQHQRTKHIKIDIHFVQEYVASVQVRVLHVPSRFQYADIFTKGLPTALFLEFR
ncbi:ribonuclease H-like domain-containing protein [Tanacetum coccineum]